MRIWIVSSYFIKVIDKYCVHIRYYKLFIQNRNLFISNTEGSQYYNKGKKYLYFKYEYFKPECNRVRSFKFSTKLDSSPVNT